MATCSKDSLKKKKKKKKKTPQTGNSRELPEMNK
jgi:hypothetical protein